MVRGENRLGELLVKSGAITGEQLRAALDESRRGGVRLGRAVVSLGFMSEDGVAVFLSRQLGAPFSDLGDISPPEDLLRKIPEQTARKRALFPLGYTNGSALIAMADPLDLEAVDELSARLSMSVETVISTQRRILGAIERYYGPLAAASGVHGLIAPERVEAYGSAQGHAGGNGGRDDPAPVARAVEAILRRGVEERASDIHIEPRDGALVIRQRIDGVLFPAPAPPKEMESAIVSRVKIMARLDIAESRAPQDGGFRLDVDGRGLEFRVSTFPTIHGESVVIRVMNRAGSLMSLGETGLEGEPLAMLREGLGKGEGIVIVTGPTGSGKTTTLYAALCAISSPEKNVVTIEDPVEHRLAGARQTQINPKAGLTFARGLRSMLRQDPDVIMVGEIRDKETARVAVQAAMTGHLVLTSTHTADSASAVTRMLDLGIEPYQLASTLKGVLAQRLARRICPDCGTAGDGGKTARAAGAGCCNGSGYRGRVGLFEFLGAGEEVKELIMARAPAPVIKERARQVYGMETMRADGLKKARRGITTVEEALRVTPHD